MSILVNSEMLKVYLSKNLDKEIEKITEEDLSEIKDIKLSRFNFLEKKQIIL